MPDSLLVFSYKLLLIQIKATLIEGLLSARSGRWQATATGQKRTRATSGIEQSQALNTDYDFKMPAPKTLEFVLKSNGIFAIEPFAVLLHPAKWHDGT
jgi:hypothetical protein